VRQRSATHGFARIAALISALVSLNACAVIPGLARDHTRYWAFTAPWDARSDSSVRAHAARFDAVVYGWIQLDTLTGAPLSLLSDTLSRGAPASTQPMAIVSNYLGDRFHPQTIRRIASQEAVLARTASEVARRATAAGYRGLVLDFEALSAADLPATLRVVRAIADTSRAHGIAPIALAIPATDTAAFPAAAFIPAVDYVLVMLYDQHWPGSPPGPIAAPEWVRRSLSRRVAEVGASRVIAALPLYGYQWPVDRPAAAVTFLEARRNAAAAGQELIRDPATATLRAARAGEWELWVTDAGLLRALLLEVQALGVRSVALWRLGQEDPAIWTDVVR
jgi:peptidoglycan-N-acetylglucosamine deacetylase